MSELRCVGWKNNLKADLKWKPILIRSLSTSWRSANTSIKIYLLQKLIVYKYNHYEEVFAVQFGASVESQESVAPHWIASVCTHRVTVWGRLVAAFQRWVIYTAAVPQCAVLNSRAPCLTADKHKLFLSCCIYGFSHTILLVQPKPYKDIQHFFYKVVILVNQIEWLL